MRVELTPSEPMTLKVRYNGEEIFSQELEVGVRFAQDIETPEVTGVAETILVIGGEELPIAQNHYTFDENTADTPPNPSEQ